MCISLARFTEGLLPAIARRKTSCSDGGDRVDVLARAIQNRVDRVRASRRHDGVSCARNLSGRAGECAQRHYSSSAAVPPRDRRISITAAGPAKSSRADRRGPWVRSGTRDPIFPPRLFASSSARQSASDSRHASAGLDHTWKRRGAARAPARRSRPVRLLGGSCGSVGCVRRFRIGSRQQPRYSVTDHRGIINGSPRSALAWRHAIPCFNSRCGERRVGRRFERRSGSRGSVRASRDDSGFHYSRVATGHSCGVGALRSNPGRRVCRAG